MTGNAMSLIIIEAGSRNFMLSATKVLTFIFSEIHDLAFGESVWFMYFLFGGQFDCKFARYGCYQG